MTSGRIFIAGLWVVGLLTGLWIARGGTGELVPVPYFTVPMVAGLVGELGIKAAGAPPLSPGERLVGVLGAAVIAFVVPSLLRG